MIRTRAQLTVSRWCELLGISRRGYYDRGARERLGPVAKGPWPSPTRDALRERVRALAREHPAWSHRAIWEQLRREGLDGSASSVRRVLGERRDPSASTVG